MSTRLCPYCAEEIKPAAIVCKHCGRELEKGTVTTSSDKNPAIGGAGLFILALSGIICALSGGNYGFASIVAFAGAGLLIYALVTGNITLFGR